MTDVAATVLSLTRQKDRVESLNLFSATWSDCTASAELLGRVASYRVLRKSMETDEKVSFEFYGINTNSIVGNSTCQLMLIRYRADREQGCQLLIRPSLFTVTCNIVRLVVLTHLPPLRLRSNLFETFAEVLALPS